MLKLANISEIEDGGTSSFARQMPDSYPIRQLPRKWWEWDYLSRSAEQLGLTSGGMTAFGLGVGNEPLIFYFAQSAETVIATDLYSASTAWSEARFADPSSILGTSPIDFRREALRIESCDMRELSARDESVDFVWSTSSIEHVPTLLDLVKVFQEIYRVLQFGGHALLTTEFCLSSDHYLLPGVNALGQADFDAFIRSLDGLELVGDVDYSYNTAHPGNMARYRRYMPSTSAIGLRRNAMSSYSGGAIANFVGVSTITPIGFVLRKTKSGTPLFNESSVDISEKARLITDVLRSFHAGQNAAAVAAGDDACFDPSFSLQDRLILNRFVVDAMARDGAMENPHDFSSRILRFYEKVPKGTLVDTDCLDLLGYLLGEMGHVDERIDIYERCLNSPSVSIEQFFDLLGRYVQAAETLGKVESALDFAVPHILELVLSGTLPSLSGEHADRLFGRANLSKGMRAKIRGAVSSEVREWLPALG